MKFKEFIKSLTKEDIGEELIKTVFISLLTSLFLFLIVYHLKLKYLEFMPKYGFLLFLAILSYSLILPSVRHVRAYREFACMSGMMIGMTIGMISGFLPGYIIGATNGMFYGSLFGMTIGIGFGVWNGKCCGVMGVMEGMMAGFMGGLMGAMTALMMFNDNLKAAGIIIFLISGFILIGLNYLIYIETKGMEKKHKEDQFFTIFWSFVLTVITIIFMVFGPRSVLLQ